METRPTAVSTLAVLTLASPALALQSPIDPAIARSCFEQARSIAAADGGELWGVSLDFPILFVDPETRHVVANRADAQGALGEWEGLWAGQYPPELGVANFATEWAGVRWTMLVWPPPEDPVDRARLLLHESFHNAQVGLDVSGSTRACQHMTTFDGRLWTRLEARAWAVALAADGEDGAREEAAADGLLFRAMRRSLFPGSDRAEDGLERVEGSAEYTGMRLCSPDPAVRVAETVELLHGLAERPSLARSFQYATGPALGLLLDGYDPFWREGFLGGASFTELLAPAVLFEAPLDPAALEERALERAEVYGLEEVAADETRRKEEREARLAAHRRRYLDGPVLILPARSPRRSFDPSRIDLLEGVGSVYGTLWLSDAWGVADAPGGGLIFDDMRVHLAAPADVEGPTLAGDGWTLELDPGWTVVPGEREGDYRVVEKED